MRRRKDNFILSLVGILILGAFITIGTTLFISTMGAVDDGVDMSGSDYEDEYDSTTDIAILSIGLIKFLPIIIGVIALLVGVVGLKKYTGF